MVTTIQIEEETRKMLFDMITSIQSKTGRRVSYDEVLKIILKKDNRTRKARRKFTQFFGSLKGESGVWEELSRLKHEEKEKLERKLPS